MALGTSTKKPLSTIRTKILEIGDWDMDAIVSVTVAHNIADPTKIRRVTAFIKPDSDVASPNYRYPIEVGDGSSDTDFQGHCWLLNNVVGVRRRTTGFFDSVSFNATGFNRGFIIVEYTR